MYEKSNYSPEQAPVADRAVLHYSDGGQALEFTGEGGVRIANESELMIIETEDEVYAIGEGVVFNLVSEQCSQRTDEPLRLVLGQALNVSTYNEVGVHDERTTSPVVKVLVNYEPSEGDLGVVDRIVEYPSPFSMIREDIEQAGQVLAQQQSVL